MNDDPLPSSRVWAEDGTGYDMLFEMPTIPGTSNSLIAHHTLLLQLQPPFVSAMLLSGRMGSNYSAVEIYCKIDL